MEKSDASTLDIAIKVNLGELAALLTEGTGSARIAVECANAYQRNAAVGAVVGLDGLLSEAMALTRATLALHRRGDG